jgi:hypothetical protein
MKDHSDQEEIDALIRTFFSAFDNRGDALPALYRVMDCFMDKAVIVRRSTLATDIYTPLEFSLPRIDLLTHGALRDFHEYETSSSTAVFGAIAVRTSRYAKLGMLDGWVYSESGTKCFQLVNDGDGWRISSLAWADDES